MPAGSHPARGSRPNIIFNLADDQGQADASVYEALRLQTPTAEKLAKSGLTFNSAFIASPACAPSREALLTGLMPSRNGAEANHTYPLAGSCSCRKPDQQSVISANDLLPGFCALAGAKLPEGFTFDGKDRSQVLLAKPTIESRTLFWEYGRRLFALRPGLLQKNI